MQKTFVLDTNVLLHSPSALCAFGKHKVVLTEAVLEELDNFKKGNSELNANARAVSNQLELLRSRGRLTDGVKMDNGGILKMELNHRDIELPGSWDKSKRDNRILQVCKALQNNGENVFLITKDIIERIKADIMGIIAQDFEFDRAPELDDQYKGRRHIYVNSNDLNRFYNDKKLELKSLTMFTYSVDDKLRELSYEDLVVNEFLILHALDQPKQTALGKINSRGFIEHLRFLDNRPYGVSPRNVGQKFMQEALMASVDEAPLVILKGPAGTAKTFYSLAVGLEQVVNKGEYRRILVCRPNITMDEKLGFLPGDESEKIAPLMRPIMDNLEILVDSDSKERYKNEFELQDKIQDLFDRKYIDSQAVGFLRGRSIVNHYLIIDEAQNLTPKQAKAIITRAGEGTKVILAGDPEQIDSPFLDSRTNGLSYASEMMKGSRLCFQVTAEDEECVRSKLALEGAQRMRNN